MFSKWRHRPSLQALISRKQRKMIIETLVTIKIQMAAFGLTKKKASPTIIMGVCQNSHPLLKYHKARTFTSSGFAIP